MLKGTIIIDAEKCLACRSCELACATAHSQSRDLEKAIKESPRPQPRVKVEGTERFSVPLQCRHCEDAPCVAICPTGAIEKLGPEEPVIIHSELCIGCKWCILACPFGVINLGPQGRAAIKCDLCIERLKEDELPACVVACPTKTLKFTSLEKLNKEKREKVLRELVSIKSK